MTSGALEFGHVLHSRMYSSAHGYPHPRIPWLFCSSHKLAIAEATPNYDQWPFAGCTRAQGKVEQRVEPKFGYAVSYDSGGDHGVMNIADSWYFLMA